MQAIICSQYGGPQVLSLGEIETPLAKENEVRIKVKATTVTAADGMIRKGEPKFGRLFLGLRKPKHSVVGTGFAGVIDAVGAKVTQFKVGDSVFGETGVNFGANAEFITLSEDAVLRRIPNGMDFEDAAPIPDGALTSLNFLKNLGQIKAGQKILINGASGGLGTAAVQLAKYFGAHVTGVCSSGNHEMVKNLGADEVIDYNNQDFTEQLNTFDIIYDTLGKRSYSECKKALTQKGKYISPVLDIPLLLQMLITSKSKGKKAIFSATGLLPVPELLPLLAELEVIIEAGGLKTVIDRRYPLAEIPKAHEYLDTGRKKGNLVILV